MTTPEREKCLTCGSAKAENRNFVFPDGEPIKQAKIGTECSDLFHDIGAYSVPGTPGSCEVCWTSSWAPCPEGTDNAVRDPQNNKWMVCQMCQAWEECRKLQERGLIDEEIHTGLGNENAELKQQVRTLQANLEANCEQATVDFAILQAERDRMEKVLHELRVAWQAWLGDA